MIRSHALIAIAALLALPASAAAASAAPPPRAADGHADFSGVWTNASVTHLERPQGLSRLVVGKAEAEAFAKATPMVRRLDNDAQRSDAEAAAPPPGDPGGYNAYWLDPGRTMGQVKGEFRSSWIVDPADGQLPLSPAGRVLVAKANAYARAADTPAGPDVMQPWDRCLIASRGSGGPGMLNNIYNSNYQIVQTPGSVAIVVEMIHDARNIPIFPSKAAAQAGHGPAALHPWLGDSTGWWEGPTLVVETINVNPLQGRQGPTPLSPRGRVVERFTRASDKAIDYAFEVDDPVNYTRPWRAELTLTAQQGLSYEFACHEGNYAIQGILSGARAAERAAPQPARADR